MHNFLGFYVINTSVRTMRLIFALFHLLFDHKRCHAICSGAYGEQPCVFTPAPPGKTPPCARPGSTYCEHPTNYPVQLIEYLIKKWVYDHSTLLSNEVHTDFNAYGSVNEGKYGYGPYPNSIHDNYYPEPIHIPKPQYPAATFNTPGPGNAYIPPAFPQVNLTGGFAGYPDRRQPLPSNQEFTFKYPGKNPQLQHPQTVFPGNVPQQTQFSEQHVPFFNQNDLWNSYINNEEKFLNYTPFQRSRRAVKLKNHKRKLRSLHFVPTNATEFRRGKRQNDISGQTLCQTRANYIMPRAAVNVKGNWMFVVNMPQMSDMYTQLVKSETCVTQTCNGICSLPNGYTSRCEQRYVQKRLVALQEAGSQLYTDLFWFPSCCLCTITQN